MNVKGSASNGATPPSAFVSYAQSSPEWQRTVLRFTVALRTVGGIDAEIDLFHTADHQQWSTFGPKQIASSQFILIAVDASYRRRWDGTESPGLGAGAAREAAAIKSIFEQDQQEALRRVKVIVLPGASLDDIPAELLGFSERFEVSSYDDTGLEPLLRSLWGRPSYEKPELGPIPTLPALSVAEAERTADAGASPSARSSPPPRGTSANPSEVDAGDAKTLERRLTQVRRELERVGSDVAESSRHDDLERERLALDASLEALAEVGARSSDESIKANMSPMLTRLVETLQHPNGDNRYEALSALDRHLTPALLPEIERLLDDPDEFVQRMAYGYYGRLAGPAGVPRLIAALNSPDSNIRYEALSALDNHLAPQLVPHIEPLLNDPDEFVQRLALNYYGRLAT